MENAKKAQDAKGHPQILETRHRSARDLEKNFVPGMAEPL